MDRENLENVVGLAVGVRARRVEKALDTGNFFPLFDVLTEII